MSRYFGWRYFRYFGARMRNVAIALALIALPPLAFGGNVAMVPPLNFVGSGGRVIGSRSGNVAMVPPLNFVGSGGRVIGSRGGNVAMVPALNFEGSGQAAGQGKNHVVKVPASHFNVPGGTQGASGNTEIPSPSDMFSAMFGAGSGQPGEGATQLSDDEVRRFVATVKELQAEGQSVRQGNGGFAAAMAYSGKMQSTLKAHGFTLQSWATTLGLVTSAMAGMEIKKETSDPNLNAQFEAERKSIEQAQDFPPAIKQQMLQQLEQQEKNMMAARHHADPNEAAVRPYLEQLQAVFGK